MIPFAGILQPLEDALQAVLEWLHGSIGLSWAWAIVVITVMVRIVILPLTVQQIRSMQRLAIFAPQLKALQEKYKHDKQRLNEEVMKFYKEHKVNPAASCLPILPQIPIFISLFYVLKGFEKDVLPHYPQSSLGFLHDWVPNITDQIDEHGSGWALLVIYGATQLLSMWLSTTTLQSKGQRYLMLILPVFFIPVVINFPVGLLIYWMTTNLWTIGQGIVTRRMFPKPDVPLPKRTSRTPPKDVPVPAPAKAAAPQSSRRSRSQPAAKKGAAKPAAKQASQDGSSQQRQVRRRKKKGPRPRP